MLPSARPRPRQSHVEILENRIAPAYTFSLIGGAATATGDTSVDHLVIDVSGGFLEYSVNGGAFSFDWDTATPSVQKLAANVSSSVQINFSRGDGSTLTLGTPSGPASQLLASFNVVALANTADAVAIDDSGGTVQNTYTVDTAPGTITGTGIHYNEFSSQPFSGGITIKGSAFDGNVFNVPSVAFGEPVSIITGSSGNTAVNIGNSGTLNAINSPVAVTAATGGSATLNIDDHNNFSPNYGVATLDNLSSNANAPFEVSGLSPKPIRYGLGVTAVNVTGGVVGASGVLFFVNNTQSGTVTTLNGGPNQNYFYLSNLTASGGLSNLSGAVVIHGGASLTDVIALGDAAADFNDSYTITSTTVGRANFGGLTYDANIGTLTLAAENSLGTNGNNTIEVSSTADHVITNIDGYGGHDVITVDQTGLHGVLNITTGGGGSTVNVIADSEPVNITLGGSDVVNVGSSGGAGTVNGISDAITLNANSQTYHLSLHDENSSVGKTWIISGNSSTGPGTISTAGVAAISFTQGAAPAFEIHGGAGDDSFDLSGLDGSGSIDGGGGTNTVIASKNSGYVLSDTSLGNSGGLEIGLSNISVANLTDTGGGNTFDVGGWTGQGTLTNTGATADTIAATKASSITLTNTSLVSTDGMELTFASGAFQTAILTDSAGGKSFDLSGWTHSATLANSGTSGSTVVVAKPSGFTLTNTSLTAPDGLSATFASGAIQTANLIDTAGGHSFTVTGWTHGGSLASQGASDTVVDVDTITNSDVPVKITTTGKAGKTTIIYSIGVVLTNSLLYSSNSMSLELTNIGTANLTAGTGGYEVLDGSHYTGNLTLTGSSGTTGVNNDTLVAGLGVNTLIGGVQADRFVLTGFSISDTLTPSIDSVNGVTAQRDVIDYSVRLYPAAKSNFNKIGVAVNLGIIGAAQAVNAQSTDPTVKAEGSLTLTGLFDDLIGSKYKDLLTGNALTNEVYGGGGAGDSLTGGGVPPPAAHKPGNHDFLIGNSSTVFVPPKRGSGEIDSRYRSGTSPFPTILPIIVPQAIFTVVQTGFQVADPFVQAAQVG